MSEPRTPGLIEVLRSTIQDVEQTSGTIAADRSLAELRTTLDRRIADLQRAMASELSEAASQPIAQDASEDFDWEMAS